jgi:DNA repair protein RadA/Sms
VRVEEPAVDLGVALAVASALRDKPVGKGTACYGEVGLTGDVRFVSGAPRRTSELLKLGFGRIISLKVRTMHPRAHKMSVRQTERQAWSR